MAILVECQCGRSFETPESNAGRKARCSGCDAILIIPQLNHPADHSGYESTGSAPQRFESPIRPATYDEPEGYGPDNGAPGPSITQTKSKLPLLIIVGVSLVGLFLLVTIATLSVSTVNRGEQPSQKKRVSYTNLKEEECVKVAEKFSSAIQDGGTRIFSFFDMDELIRLVTVGIEAPVRTKASFVSALKKELRKGKMGVQLHDTLEGGGTCQLVNIREERGQTVGLIRLNSIEYYNYVKLIFCRDGRGQVRIADVYLVATGEKISTSMRRYFVASMASVDRNVNRMQGWEGDLIRHQKELRQLEEYSQTNPQLAIETYKKLPKSLQQMGAHASTYVSAAQQVSIEEYQIAVQALDNVLNGEALAAFYGVGLQRNQGEYGKSLDAIQKLEDALGKDPFLDIMRHSIYEEMGDKPNSQKYAQLGVAGLQTKPVNLQYESQLLGRRPKIEFTLVEKGVRRAIVQQELTGPSVQNDPVIHLYLPEGEHEKGSLPCIFIASAGGTYFSGREVTDADEPEFIPYVKEGFAVVGYETDGEIGDGETVEDMQTAFEQYRNSSAGLKNAATSVEFVLRDIPEIDPNRLYVAGHSSAAKQAFLLAAHDQRIKGCLCYNGVLDHSNVATQLPEMVYLLSNDALSLIRESSPRKYETHIRCPVFLFHTREDSVVLADISIDCEKRLKELGVDTTLVLESGDHYTPMIEKGIPAGIEWLKTLDQKVVGEIGE